MTTTHLGRPNSPADNPHVAMQKKGRAANFHVIRARNFGDYRNTSADALGHVLIFDLRGEKLAGPFDLEACDAWLGEAKGARHRGEDLRKDSAATELESLLEADRVERERIARVSELTTLLEELNAKGSS